MSKVISILNHANDEVIRNHRHFCALMGYEHTLILTEFIDHERLRLAYKYNILLQALSREPENDWICLLDQNTMVIHPTRIETLLNNRTHLVVNAPPAPNAPNLVMGNILIFRNTPDNRHALTEMTRLLHASVATLDIDSEEILLQKFQALECNGNIDGTYVNVHWSINNWQAAHIFVVNLGPQLSLDERGKVRQHIVHDLNLQQLLTRQINNFVFHKQAILTQPNYPALSNEPISCFNQNAKIALITLYTDNIAVYGRVSETNVKRYCDRHGYAYWVYRAIPSEIVQDDVCGSWFKPWLLKQHLKDYDWVIWIDADILFRNQSLKLEPLLEGRDLLFAKDICDWPINAGVMGFRNTIQNSKILEQIWQRTLNVADKSSVYSAYGDQYHTIEVLKENHMLNENSVVNCLDINTPPNISTTHTLLTHYIGLGEPTRSVYMAHDDQLSQSSSA